MRSLCRPIALAAIPFLFSLSCFAEPTVPKPNRDFIEAKLTKNGFSKPFIQDLEKNYEEKDFEEVVRLNILLFLKKADYHGPQVTPQAGEEVREFIEANKMSLTEAEKTYHVPGDVIASLLFMESRYGKHTGNFHVPSVYLHLIQAPRKEVQIYLQSQAKRYADKVKPAEREKIRERTHHKSDWALGELHALEKAFKRRWKLDKDFRGSFSGAFGMPQFIPSSYVRWARAKRPAAQPALDNADDAITSVAYFLHGHGWKSGSSKARIKALMKYNNSLDYAKAILALSDQVKSRSTASAPKSTDSP